MGLSSTKGPDIEKTKNILIDLGIQIEKNKSAFSNFNIVRMREAIRYLTRKKLEIFIKIPFLLHINSSEHPGFIDLKDAPHGIWNFEKSGFYKEAIKTKIFPRSAVELNKIDIPAILGFYHIGSLGTFTQSLGSDFDYWVIIEKKFFSKERYDALEKKLDAILKYCREAYDQEVTFFVMDQKEVRDNCYASFEGEETLTAPKIFLKEEFYRTFLMIAGKIPVWCVLPDIQDLPIDTPLNITGLTAQVLSMYDDLIDLGHITSPPPEDVLKGLLWHISKSESDPVKAVIKATMIFSYGFRETRQALLCEKIKQGYSKAGIDDFEVDPYKLLFDQILEFHDKTDPKGTNLIKNAIFFRLCGYPDVKMPDQNTPKRLLLEKYILSWKLNQNQVGKLLSYSTWSESEKLLLEKTLIQRLAQMYNHAIQETCKTNTLLDFGKEKKNWILLKNKTRKRLNKNSNKVPECSTYLKRRSILKLDIVKKIKLWELNMLLASGQRMDRVYIHSKLAGVFGWVLENQLYKRHTATITLDTDLSLFESVGKPIDMDTLYMAFQPLKPLSDMVYEQEAAWEKMAVFLLYDKHADNNKIYGAEFLITNTWGELFLDTIEFPSHITKQDQCSQIINLMSGYSNLNLRIYIYQVSDSHDPEIVYHIKKAYSDLRFRDKDQLQSKKKPYLDRL